MIRLIFFLLIVLVSSQVSAQEKPVLPLPAPPPDTVSIQSDAVTKAILANSSTGHIMWHDVKNGWYDLGQYVTRPLHWDAREWAIIGTGIAFTSMLQLVDDIPIRNLVQNNRGATADQFVNFGNNFYGNGYATALTTISLYSIGLATDNNKLRTMGLHVLESFAYSGLTTSLLKIIIGRNRPFLGNGRFSYGNFSLQDALNSMPSGHVTVAAALSESLAADIDNTYVSILLYSFVAATAYSRMYSDVHWLSDTFLAGVIGTCSAFWVTHQPDHYDLKTNDPKPTSFEIVPSLTGLSLAYHF